MSAVAAFRRALHPRQLRQSLWVMLIVGTILNLINQGDGIWRDEELSVVKAALTYVVPFCVATFGAWSALRQTETLQGSATYSTN